MKIKSLLLCFLSLLIVFASSCSTPNNPKSDEPKSASAVSDNFTLEGVFATNEWKCVRKHHDVSDSISDESYWKQLRARYTDFSEITDKEFWNAVILEKEYPAYIESEIASCNSTASSLKNECYGFLYKYKKSSLYKNNSIINFVVDENGTWSCSSDEYQELLIDLKKLFNGLKQCSMLVSLSNGYCTAAVYIKGYDQPIIAGEDCPVILGNGNFADGFEWDGQTSGINSKGYFVGTAPMVPLGTSPEIPVTNVPLATVPQTDEIYYWSS